MSTHVMTPERLRRLGIEALSKKLGLVGMVRFLQQFESGSGDYTRERRHLLKDLDVAAIVQEIRKKRKSSPAR